MRIRSARRAASLTIAFAAAALVQSAARAEPLDHDGILRKLVGQPLRWQGEMGGVGGRIFFREDGIVEMTTSLPGLQRDLGSWRLSGSEICTRWDRARAGIEKCYSLVERIPGQFVSSGGNIFEVNDPMT